MNAPPFAPLRNPPGWPPPDAPPPGEREVRLRTVPVIGGVLAWPLTCLRWKRHERTALVPLGNAICDRLESRPVVGRWPTDPLEVRVARVVSEAVGLEKGVGGVPHGEPVAGRRGPALHPEDPMPLLLWGPVDDLTPAILFLEFEKPRFGVPRDRTQAAVKRAWFEGWTCRRFVEHVAELAANTNRDRQGVGPGDPRAVGER